MSLVVSAAELRLRLDGSRHRRRTPVVIEAPNERLAAALAILDPDSATHILARTGPSDWARETVAAYKAACR